MKILYDTQIFDLQKIGGISRYYYELINKVDDKNLIFPYKFTINQYLLENKFNNVMKFQNQRNLFFPNFNFKGKTRLFNLYNKIKKIPSLNEINKNATIEALNKQDFDIFHPTYYDPYFLKYIGDKPFVLTIYDMIHEKFPEFFLTATEIQNKYLLASKATKIIAISETTKNDIIELYGPSFESKIEVIYLGSSLFKPNTLNNNFKEKFGNYILFTGSRTIYKNFYFFLLSVKDYIISNNLSVLCTGITFSPEEKVFIHNLGIEDKVHIYFANEADFYSLYNQAFAFIFPSYYEGFGIPVLEAFQSEVPCLVADTTCFREIGGPACIYFDPKSKKSILEALDKVSDTNNRKKYIDLGKTRLTNFSWDKTAEQTINLYNKIIGENSNM